MDAFNIILPVFTLIAIGYFIRKRGYVSQEDFDGVENLSFRLLLPAMIINAIYHSEMSLSAAGPFVLAAIVVVSLSGILTLVLRVGIGRDTLPAASHSSLFQATTRWNGLMSLSFAGAAFGETGLALIAIAMAFLIPFVNVINITALSLMHNQGVRPLGILKAIVQNPLIIGSGIGLLLNFTGVKLPGFAEQTLGYVSQATLAMAILVIGAGFQLRRLVRPGWQVMWAVLVKNALAPLGFLLLSRWFSLSDIETVCGMLIVSAPAAANGYIVARKMGGDAPLFAYAMTWQLVASILTIPLILTFAV